MPAEWLVLWLGKLLEEWLSVELWLGLGQRLGLKFGSTVEEKAIESPVRLALSCTCWIAAANLAYALLPSRIILNIVWLAMQTADEDADLVAVDCVLLRSSRLSGSWKGQTVVLAVGLMAG